MPGRGGRRWPVLWLLAVAVFVAGAAGVTSAQPYAAAGGFGRPQHVAGPGISATIAVAEDRGAMLLVWADTQGVWQRGLLDTNAVPVQLVPPGSVRGLAAAAAGGDIAVAWLQRDLTTGKTRHSLLWRGRAHLLFEANLEVQLLVGAAGGAPWVLAAPRVDGRANLTLYRFDTGGEPLPAVVLHETELGVTGIRAGGEDPELGGPAVIGWLEGRTSTTSFGSDSEWYAYVAAPGRAVAAGTDLGAVAVRLGLADVVDQRQAVAVGLHGEAADGTRSVHALWLRDEGPLELSTLRLGADGLVVTGRVDLGEVGRPVTILDDEAYWLSDAFVRRATLGSDGSPEEVVSVAWSPVPIEGAGVALQAGAAPGEAGVTSLAWYGRLVGGAVSAYASDDSVPLRPTLADRIASTMGWSPWTLWQEALGQALTAAIAGIAVTLGLAPLLFLLAVVVARLGVGAGRAPLVGALIGVATPLLIALAVALRYPSQQLAQVMSVGSLALALPWLALGVLVGWLVARGGDREAQLTIFVGATGAALTTAGVLAFVHYHGWATFIGLV